MFDANWSWWFRQLRRMLFFRAALIAALSVFTAFAAYFAKYFIPDNVALQLGSEAVDSILTIIASSMLAVTTFSLSTVVAAHASAASMATPRATELLISDTTAQTMLSTFVGAFIYSLVGLILLKTGLYGPAGRFILFAVTVAVVILLVATLLRWIDFLLQFGRLGEVVRRVHDAAAEAMRSRRDRPYLGGVQLDDAAGQVSLQAQLVRSTRSGYLQHIEMSALQRLADERGVYINLLVQPGTRVHADRPIAAIDGGAADAGLRDAIESALALGADRSFFQDPRFGVTVLGEIASRALSPGINDPGTAIAVIGRAVDAIGIWAPPLAKEPEVLYPRVRVPPVELSDLFEAFFAPVARDGAGVAEVQIRIQKGLHALAVAGQAHGDERFGKLALEHSSEALARAEKGLLFSGDLERVRAAAAPLQRFFQR